MEKEYSCCLIVITKDSFHVNNATINGESTILTNHSCRPDNLCDWQMYGYECSCCSLIWKIVDKPTLILFTSSYYPFSFYKVIAYEHSTENVFNLDVTYHFVWFVLVL